MCLLAMALWGDGSVVCICWNVKWFSAARELVFVCGSEPQTNVIRLLEFLEPVPLRLVFGDENKTDDVSCWVLK